MRRRWRRHARTVGLYVSAIVATVLALFPIVWGLLTSLKAPHAIFRSPPQWWPDPVTVTNFDSVIFGSNMLVYLRNSIVVTASVIVLVVLVASLGAYALARFRFRYMTAIGFLVLATSMIPTIAVVVPIYSIAARVGLHDTFAVLILTFAAFQIPMSMWLLQSFFLSIPESIEEAAFIDGCSRFQTYWRVALPLARPGLAASSVLVWVYCWNDFIIPITLTSSDSRRVVSTGLYYYITIFGIEWGLLMAAVALVLLPALLTFGFLQRSFVSGLTAGSTKG